MLDNTTHNDRSLNGSIATEYSRYAFLLDRNQVYTGKEFAAMVRGSGCISEDYRRWLIFCDFLEGTEGTFSRGRGIDND